MNVTYGCLNLRTTYQLHTNESYDIQELAPTFVAIKNIDLNMTLGTVYVICFNFGLLDLRRTISNTL